MQEILTMSTKERQRLQVIGHLKHGKTTVTKTAAALGLSESQMYRVLGRYRKQGDEGLLHRLRGHSSNRGYSDKVREITLRVYQESYPRLWSHAVRRDARRVPSPPDGLRRNNIFCFETTRYVNHDYTIAASDSLGLALEISAYVMIAWVSSPPYTRVNTISGLGAVI